MQFTDPNDNTKIIHNPLVPIGTSIQLAAIGGDEDGELTWSVEGSAPGFTVNSTSLPVTFTVNSNAVVGSATSIMVTDGKGHSGTTMLIAAPQGVMSQHLLLIYGVTETAGQIVSLCVKETGLCTRLGAVPGIIDTTKALDDAPLYQVTPNPGEAFVSCYVLNLRSASFGDWVPGLIQSSASVSFLAQFAPQSQRQPLSQRQPQSQRQPPSVQVVA